MDKITRVGVDLAKNIMQIHAVDSAERVVVRKAISRERFVGVVQNPPFLGHTGERRRTACKSKIS